MRTKYLVYVKITGNNSGSYILKIDLDTDTIVSVIRDPTSSVKPGDKLKNIVRTSDNINSFFYTKKEIIEMVFAWRGWKW
jgi:hypothetical protein